MPVQDFCLASVAAGLDVGPGRHSLKPMRDTESAPLPPSHARFGEGIPLRFALAVLSGLVLIHALRLGLLAGPERAWLAVSGLFLLTSLAVARLMRRAYPHARLGGCNVVTLMRVAMTCALVAPLLIGKAGGAYVALIAGVALALDGVDGWLARRSGLVSNFGARFDIETDAALALVLSLHVLVAGTVGPVVLLLGLMRYAFVVAGLFWGWLTAPLPPSLRRKAVCVLQIAALILLQLPFLPGTMPQLLAWGAVLALFWSFATDILWLSRARK